MNSAICLVKHSDSKDYYSSLPINKEEDESFKLDDDDDDGNYQKMKILLGLYDTTELKRLKDILPSIPSTSSVVVVNNKKSLLKRNSVIRIPTLIDHNHNSLRELSFGPQYDSTDCNISYSEYYSYYCSELLEEEDQSISTQTQLTDVLSNTFEVNVDELIKKYSTTSTFTSNLDDVAKEFQKEFNHYNNFSRNDLNVLIESGWDLLMELKRIQDDRINSFNLEESIGEDEMRVYLECKEIVVELLQRMEGQHIVHTPMKMLDYGRVVYREEYGYNGVMKNQVQNTSVNGVGGVGEGMIPPQLLPKGGI